MRHDFAHELVTVPAGTAIVGLEDKPSIGRGQRRPLIPIRLEVVPVGVRWTTMDQRKHSQMLGAKLSRRIDQHAFHGAAVIGGPTIRFSLRKLTLGEKLIE